MPTFTAIALDTLLEPGASKSVDKPVPISKPTSKSKPVSNQRLERRNSASVTERKFPRPQITPALYATPEATPLPDSPISFPPSPYIINHKRRGPRLMKSYSEQNVLLQQKTRGGEEVNGSVKNAEMEIVSPIKNDPVTFSVGESNEEPRVNGVLDCGSHNSELSNGKADQVTGDRKLGSANGECCNDKMEVGSSSFSNNWAINDFPKQVGLDSERDSEREDFFDPQESLGFSSNTDGEDNAEGEHSESRMTPVGEFFDAWDDLFSDGGQQQPSHFDVEAQLRELRLSLLMETDVRKQAEEALNNLQNQWQRIRQRLSIVGLTLPADVPAVAETEQVDLDPAEDLCRQVYLARFVSNCIGRGLARAEMEKEMEAQIEAKNFEIARLLDKLRNYEAMNQEMVQRNRDVIENSRRERERKERRQRWVWGSIAAVLTIGTAALAWSYLPSGRGYPTYDSQVPDSDDAAN